MLQTDHPHRSVSEPGVLQAQAIRLPTWDKPCVISSIEGFAQRSTLGTGLFSVFDYVDALVPRLARMYDKRLKEYRAIKYEIQPIVTEDQITGYEERC
jgi:hypothetical protein